MTTNTTSELDANKAKLAKLIKGIDIGMLTTIDENGKPHSRPMSVNKQVDFDGDLWFFTYGKSHKVVETEAHPHVNVSFSDIKNNNYVSVTGRAVLIRDKDIIKAKWLPELKAWFPEGTETEDIALLKICAEQAEYWDMPNSVVAHALAFVKQAAGMGSAIGEDVKLSL